MPASITKSEYGVLTALWSNKQGLTASEINTWAKDKPWKESSIHLLLSHMLDKGLILVDGMSRSGRTYSRIFKAAISPEDYSILQVKQNIPYFQSKHMASLFASLVNNDEVNTETINKIEQLLKRKEEP